MSDYITDACLVSVVIPSYNRDVSVMSRSIESVLNQTYSNIEIIVVDDNPNDSPYCGPIKHLCEKYDNVVYLKQDGNKGACAARNLGIQHARGSWIGFLDDDDEWLPSKIEKSVPHFRQNVGIIASPGFILYENEDGRVINCKPYNYNPDHKTIISHDDFLEKDLIGSTSQAIVNKQCFIQCGGFDEQFPARQDYEMWIRISQRYDVYYIDEPLFNHYIHAGEQISTNPRKSVIGFKKILKKYNTEFHDNPHALIRMNVRIFKSAISAKDYVDVACSFLRFLCHPIASVRYLVNR